MAIVTEGQLRQQVPYKRGTITGETRRWTKYQAERSVFLSHSRKDEDLALLVKEILEGLGVTVYVDWLDGGLPETVSRATAALLRERIAENRLLLLLATPNALLSRWVPWELGYADGKNDEKRVAVLPVLRAGETFKGNEYIDLYTRIEIPGVQVGFSLDESMMRASGQMKGAESWIKYS